MGQKKNKKQKIRAEFRKNRAQPARTRDLTRRYEQDGFVQDDSARTERISGKGELTRKRTVLGSAAPDSTTGMRVSLSVDQSKCMAGRVLSVHGLVSTVQAAGGKQYRCSVRRLLKTLSTDQRHVVAAGDHVQFQMAGPEEGVIVRVEPRRGVLCRTSRSRQQVIVANVDQLVIVASAAEPQIKPNLIDRLLVTAEKAGTRPLICINKMDLVDPADLQPLIGVYGQLGYAVLLASAVSGLGIDRLRAALAGRESVVIGQSGVGKSSLLNAVDHELALEVLPVSAANEKGRHTTTTAHLIPLSTGGFVVDTPGMRQFDLWDVIPQEVAGYFVDLRPYVSLCRFPNCTHRHEAHCAVKDAVADGRIDARRYESYCRLYSLGAD
jgi:ribosome biogenesis GTPase